MNKILELENKLMDLEVELQELDVYDEYNYNLILELKAEIEVIEKELNSL